MYITNFALWLNKKIQKLSEYSLKIINKFAGKKGILGIFNVIFIIVPIVVVLMIIELIMFGCVYIIFNGNK
jgi:hypothetical protein